jgi:RNA polymerase sigma-70 factor (ECF subfamily)
MKKAQTPQEIWFMEEVLPHEQDLRRWMGSRFSGVRDVDDLVQETFTRTLKAHASGPIVNPRAFLFVTARNLALNHLRHFKYERPPLEDESTPLSIADELHCPMETAARREEVRQLRRAIQSLPERCREIVTLRKIYGLSQKEVADELGIAVSTVKAQLAIGMSKCIQYFRETGFINKYKS